MSHSRTASSLALCGVLLGIVACKTKGEAEPVTPAAPSAVASSQPTAEAKVKPWFSGGFAAEYEAKLAPVEIKVGALKEWTKDDGKLSSGPGKMNVQIDDTGQVDGTSEGALGTGRVSGRVEDDTLRVQLSPTDEAGLHGVLVATRDGDGFKGSLEASSGDSLRVRTASVELKKSPGGARQAN